MKVIVKYDVNELDAITEMVVKFNPHAAEKGALYVKNNIIKSMERFKDDETIYTGTFGYIVIVADEEMPDENTKVLYVEFYFQASTYASSQIKCKTPHYGSLVVQDDGREHYWVDIIGMISDEI